jgi:hypothetical protein
MSLPRPASLLLRLGLPAALALLWMACSGNVSSGHGDPCCGADPETCALGDGCHSDADCIDGEICNVCGQCSAPVDCAPDAGCPSGSTCDSPSGGFCTTGAPCTYYTDCPTGAICKQGLPGSRKCYLVHP